MAELEIKLNITQDTYLKLQYEAVSSETTIEKIIENRLEIYFKGDD